MTEESCKAGHPLCGTFTPHCWGRIHNISPNWSKGDRHCVHSTPTGEECKMETCSAGHARCTPIYSSEGGTCLIHDMPLKNHYTCGTRIGHKCRKEKTCSKGHEKCWETQPNTKLCFTHFRDRGKHCTEGHPIGQECKEAPQEEKIKPFSSHELNGIYITLDRGKYITGEDVRRLKETIRGKDEEIKKAGEGLEVFRKCYFEIVNMIPKNIVKEKIGRYESQQELVSRYESAEAQVNELKAENERLKGLLMLETGGKPRIYTKEVLEEALTPKDKPEPTDIVRRMKQYIKHHSDCNFVTNLRECNCGFNGLLAKINEEETNVKR